MPQYDNLDKYGQSDPASTVVAVTQSDATNDPNGPFRGICFAVAGAIKITDFDGNATVITSGALSAGVIHPIRVKRVWSTGTTATGIFGVR